MKLVKGQTLARVLAEQVYDNCLGAAGLMDDSRSMLPRLNDILMCVVKGAKIGGGAESAAFKDSAADPTPESSSPEEVKEEPVAKEEPIVKEETKPDESKA